jgi:hypothetical protein
MPGAEGFIRLARRPFWSAGLDGAFYTGKRLGDFVCAGDGNSDGCGDERYLGKIATLAVTIALGPTANTGLRPLYGLIGAGGVATWWGGGVGPSGGGEASCAGPTLALLEAGIGTEFHALGGNRIEFRIHRASRSFRLGSDPLAAIGTSLTIGVVW